MRGFFDASNSKCQVRNLSGIYRTYRREPKFSPGTTELRTLERIETTPRGQFAARAE
jgi:hypothetical protein